MTQILRLEQPDGQRIAYLNRTANATGPGVLWLSGFKSDMTGTKATALDAWAARTGRGYTRFDYFGHGASSGDFREGTISRWGEDALTIIDRVAQGKGGGHRLSTPEEIARLEAAVERLLRRL